MKTKLFIAFCLLFTIKTYAKKLNFCSITLNSSDEIEYFKKNLPSDEFKFTELTRDSDNFDKDWMEASCQRHNSLNCDVLLISGHFAGEVFFGVNGQSGRRVFTHHLLDKVCNESCDNILKNPKLVFLFGGHTLSEKTNATRKEKTQLAKAVSKEIGAGAHQRLAEARYGIYGKAYLQQMKRVFGKNATLLGFDGRGVKGSRTKRKLKSFLSRIKNLKLSIENNNDSLNNFHNTKETIQSIAPIIGKSFLRSFGRVGGSVCQNYSPSKDLTYTNLNSTICLITNESSGYLYNKIEVIESVLKSPEQSELVLPWIEEFFRKHPPVIAQPNYYKNRLDNNQFIELKESFASTDTKELLEKSVKKSDGGFTKFQVLSTMRYLDLLNNSEFVSQAKPLLKKELRKLRYLDQDTIDLLCQLWPTLEIINTSEDILARYNKKWKEQMTKLNKCIDHEKQRLNAH